jgi:uncharacterized membrane protein
MKVLTLVLILDLHSIIVPQLLQIFNQMPEISVDVIPRLFWLRYQERIQAIGAHCDWPCAMCTTAQERIHAIYNQGGRFKIVSTIGHVLCVLLLKKGFMSSVLIAILIFLGSMANSGFHESMFHHCVASAGCLIIPAS